MRELNLSIQTWAKTCTMPCRKGFIWQCHRVHAYLHASSLQYSPSKNAPFPCLFASTFLSSPLCFTFPPSFLLRAGWLILPLPLPTAPGPPTPPAAVTVVEPRGRRGPRRGAAARTDRAPRSSTSATPGTRGCTALPALGQPPSPVCDSCALPELGTASRQRLGNDLLSSLWDKDNGDPKLTIERQNLYSKGFADCAVGIESLKKNNL